MDVNLDIFHVDLFSRIVNFQEFCEDLFLRLPNMLFDGERNNFKITEAGTDRSK